MKKKLLAAVLFGVLAMSAGCTKSNILKPEQTMNAPDFTPVDKVDVDWDQVSKDVMSFYEDIEYPGLLTFNFGHKDEEKQITAQLYVDESVSPKSAAGYASDLIKYINDSVAAQGGSISLSGNDSYGSFFDEYSFTVQVIPELSQDDENDWLVNMTVAAGEHTPITWLEGNKEEAGSEEAEELKTDEAEEGKVKPDEAQESESKADEAQESEVKPDEAQESEPDSR